MKSFIIYFSTISLLTVNSQWQNGQQSWPTHPPQVAPQPQWNNPSPYWNNPHQPWGANPVQPYIWPTTVKSTATVPTTEPPDSPPQKIVVIQPPPSSHQWQNPNWFAQPGHVQNGWGPSPGLQAQPPWGPMGSQQYLGHPRQNQMHQSNWGGSQPPQPQWIHSQQNTSPGSNHHSWNQYNQQKPAWKPTGPYTQQQSAWPQQESSQNKEHWRSHNQQNQLQPQYRIPQESNRFRNHQIQQQQRPPSQNAPPHHNYHQHPQHQQAQYRQPKRQQEPDPNYPPQLGQTAEQNHQRNTQPTGQQPHYRPDTQTPGHHLDLQTNGQHQHTDQQIVDPRQHGIDPHAHGHHYHIDPHTPGQHQHQDPTAVQQYQQTGQKATGKHHIGLKTHRQPQHINQQGTKQHQHIDSLTVEQYQHSDQHQPGKHRHNDPQKHGQHQHIDTQNSHGNRDHQTAYHHQIPAEGYETTRLYDPVGYNTTPRPVLPQRQGKHEPQRNYQAIDTNKPNGYYPPPPHPHTIEYVTHLETRTAYVRTTTIAPNLPPQQDYYVQSQLGPPETVTSDPSVRVQKYLTNALNHPPVWPVEPYKYDTTTIIYNAPAPAVYPNPQINPGQPNNYIQSSHDSHPSVHGTVPQGPQLHDIGPPPPGSGQGVLSHDVGHPQHIPPPAVNASPITWEKTNEYNQSPHDSHAPVHDVVPHGPPQHDPGPPPPSVVLHDAGHSQYIPPPAANPSQISPTVASSHSDVITTPAHLKYGVTHPDGSVTEESYSLVASRIQRIVSFTTDFIKRMTSYILFDRNRKTFALRSKTVRDICYAGILDQDLVDSYKEVVNKTLHVEFPYIDGNSKVFFYKEEEQILFSDALREAGHYVAGSCGKDSLMFRISRVRNPETRIGSFVVPGDACSFGPPLRHNYYSVSKCNNGTCPPSYYCNLHYDVCCPDMPVTTNCFSFSVGQLCVTYMPGRRIID